MSDFKTTADIQRYLLGSESHKIISLFQKRMPPNNIIGYKDGFLYNYTLDTGCSRNFDCPSDWAVYKEKKWTDDIPEKGIICKIPDRVSPVLIVEFEDDNSGFPYFSEDDSFLEATPLTDLEIIEYLSDKDLIAHIKNHLNNRKTK